MDYRPGAVIPGNAYKECSTNQKEETVHGTAAEPAADAASGSTAEEGFINVLVQRFNEGGEFMWPVLISLIIGLAIAFERIITLNLADINTRKFILQVKKALEEGGIQAAEEICAKTRGPVASVFQAGLLRADEGIEAVEKAIVSYGSIEMSFLERGLVWLSLFISLARCSASSVRSSAWCRRSTRSSRPVTFRPAWWPVVSRWPCLPRSSV